MPTLQFEFDHFYYYNQVVRNAEGATRMVFQVRSLSFKKNKLNFKMLKILVFLY